MIEIELQKANRLINSSPVMILSTRLDATLNFMAVTWVSWLSSVPPLLGVSVSPGCFSDKLIRESGEFVLNVIDRPMILLAHQVGTCCGRNLDKQRVFDISTHWGKTVKPLSLSHAIGTLECMVQSFRKIGDRDFFVAKVMYASVDGDYWDGWWTASAELVHYLGSHRYQCGNELICPEAKTDYLSLRQTDLELKKQTHNIFKAPPPGPPAEF